jgi:hypothetical protein
MRTCQTRPTNSPTNEQNRSSNSPTKQQKRPTHSSLKDSAVCGSLLLLGRPY